MTQNANAAPTDRTNQASAFRLWVQRIWHENCEEHLTFGEDPYKLQEYWSKYKYWLKREYRHHRKNNV